MYIDKVMHPRGRIDSIIDTFSRMIEKLEKAHEFHKNEADYHDKNSVISGYHRDEHRVEADRALALSKKIESLILV